MVPPDPWSLHRGKGGPAGNWSRPALEARWRIVVICAGRGRGNAKAEAVFTATDNTDPLAHQKK